MLYLKLHESCVEKLINFVNRGSRRIKYQVKYTELVVNIFVRLSLNYRF